MVSQSRDNLSKIVPYLKYSLQVDRLNSTTLLLKFVLQSGKDTFDLGALCQQNSQLRRDKSSEQITGWSSRLRVEGIDTVFHT